MQQLSLIASLAVALLVGLILLLTSHWHGHWSTDSNAGIQRNHSGSTPRIGGVAVVAGALAGWAWGPEASQPLLGFMLLAGTPAFAFGLVEDLSKRVSVSARLLATLSCGVLGYLFTGHSIRDVQVPGMDWLLGSTLLSVAFTAFAAAGVANAVNIIDGMNGLASGTVIVILCSFALMSQALGDVALMQTCLILGAATLGFLLLNWPMGKIFLGDGGAYFLGFSVAWVAVLLLQRHPEVSAWAPLLVCSYPVLEVLFSVQRRWRRNRHMDAPDRLHLHSLIKRRLVRHLLPKGSRLARNSVSGAILWGAGVLPAYIAYHWYTNTMALAFGLVMCALMYSAFYTRLTQFRWCLWSFLEQSLAKAPARP